MAITGIFGPPGCGKSSLNCYFAVRGIVGGFHRYLDCKDEIDNLNLQGYNFGYPTQEHCIYSNFEITAFCRGSKDEKTYPVNPFEMDLPNDDIPYAVFLPYSQFHITEGQVYWNSRRKGLRDCVSRWFENHRHNHFDIFIDCQRIGLLDLNIRELMTNFIRPLKMTFKYDELGRIIHTTWHCVEFASLAKCEKYIETQDLTLGKLTTYEFEGNIFACYKSFSNQLAFYNCDKDNAEFSIKTWKEVPATFMQMPKNYYEKGGNYG